MKSAHRNKAKFDVIMLTTVHPAADVRIFDREATTLQRAGLRVCIIGRHRKSEYREGVWIEALPTPANRFCRFLMAFTLLKHASRFSGKLYAFHDPELFGVGLVLRLLGRSVVYDCHENTPMTILQKEWIPLPLRWFTMPVVAAVEWLGSRLLTGVVTVNETLQRRFPRTRTIVVRNLPPAALLDTITQAPPLYSRANAVVYAGKLSRIRGIGELVEAFRGIDSGTELWLLGDFSERAFRQEILSTLPANVKWFGEREWADVLGFYHRAKAGVVLLYPTPNHRNAMPIKLFEYLGAGLPVIASDMPHFAELLQGCGVQVNPKDVAQIRTTITTLLSDEAGMAKMSRVGRERVMQYFRWEDDGRKLVDFYTKIATMGKTSVAYTESGFAD
jgi:glycosyltransferase involved in cell wall biosynthesis